MFRPLDDAMAELVAAGEVGEEIDTDAVRVGVQTPSASRPSRIRGAAGMDKWTFGFTMMLVAGGGTFVTLWVLGLIIDLLKRLFPLAPEKPRHD